MSNKITLFVSISLFVILSAFVVLSKDQGKYKITLVLNDGQTVLLDSILTKFPDNSISENFSSINLSSAILRSFDSDTNNINDFKIYVNDLLINKYVDYWQVTPSSNSRLSDFRYIFEENNSDFNSSQAAVFSQNSRSHRAQTHFQDIPRQRLPQWIEVTQQQRAKAREQQQSSPQPHRNTRDEDVHPRHRFTQNTEG